MTLDLHPGDFIKVRRYLPRAQVTVREAGCVLSASQDGPGDRVRIHLQESPDDMVGRVFTCWPEEILEVER